jgi:LytS/YehU family sensor histidine kinase
MNPHFIFNAPNGVQSVMILQGEQMAKKYLGIFSKLLRFTIEMTNTEMISLEDELGYLSAYVELQKMRMQSAIEYNVEVDQKDEEYICNLEGEKNITLSLNQKEHLFSHISFFSNQFIQ